MTINHNNIEEYLLDYLDGNLDPVITAELMAFLAENPEYEELIRDTSHYKLMPTGDHFPDPEFLKKAYRDLPEINPGNFDEFCIASSEGLLDHSDSERLNRYIGEDIRKIKNLKLFNSLKLVSDFNIHYPDKARLKKTSGFQMSRRFYYYGFAVAASLALLLLLTLNKSENSLPEAPAEKLSSITTSEPANKPVTDPNTEGYRFVENSSSQPESGVTVKENTVAIRAGSFPVADDAPSGGESVTLAELEPIMARVNPIRKDNARQLQKLLPEKEVKPAKPEQQLRMESESLFAGLLQKIDFWKTAETAISGFNYLTEANISIDRITDDQGRLSRLTLNTESYSIEGKLK